jgi:DNA repair photolyase
MIQTSYFAKAARLPNAVAISQGIPDWYNGARYKPLAPSWEIIHIKDPELYNKRYCLEVLSKLDPNQVATDLDGCVLLCHEKDSTHCHRRIVAEWLEAALGIDVPEMDYAVKKMPNLWDFEKTGEKANEKVPQDETTSMADKEVAKIDEVSWKNSGLKAGRLGDPGDYKLKAIHCGRGAGFPELILNIYSGCSHGCWYCYNGHYRDKSTKQVSYNELCNKILDKAAIENIEQDLLYLKKTGNKMPVVISNWGDPYDLGRKPEGLSQYIGGDNYVRRVLKKFREYDHPFMILTKGEMKAEDDFDLYGPNDWFGVTLTCDNDADSKRNEPGAALWSDRITALEKAHDRGIHTWVSLEPVIYPKQTLHLIELTSEFVDQFRVGKLNHYEKQIDWPKFRGDAEVMLQLYDKQQTKEACGIGYLLDYQLTNAR